MVQLNDDNKPVLPDGNGGFVSCPELMTEEEVIRYLRIPEISKAKPHNTIENLKRMRSFPTLSICNKVLYPLEAVRKWLENNTSYKD